MRWKVKMQNKLTKSAIRTIILWVIIIAIIIWRTARGDSLGDIISPDVLILVLLINASKKSRPALIR